jgi:hypothetical protein
MNVADLTGGVLHLSSSGGKVKHQGELSARVVNGGRSRAHSENLSPVEVVGFSCLNHDASCSTRLWQALGVAPSGRYCPPSCTPPSPHLPNSCPSTRAIEGHESAVIRQGYVRWMQRCQAKREGLCRLLKEPQAQTSMFLINIPFMSGYI